MRSRSSKDTFVVWLTEAAILLFSPLKWPSRILELLQFLLTRAEILIYSALLFFVVANSSNLQVIGAFKEVEGAWVHVVTCAIVAISATLLFALRKPHGPLVTRYLDVPAFLLPLVIIALVPPWGVQSFLGAFAVLVVQILSMIPLFARPLWDSEEKILKLFGVIIGMFAVLYAATSVNAVDFGRLATAVVLVALFVSLISILIGTLLRWPGWAFAALVWIVVAFGGDFEFRHEAKYHPLPQYERMQYLSADPFALWLLDRPDADFYRQNELPYPVFLISSEGGGGYAKAHAYTFLSKMSERCPNFAQHVYALIGVSGGQIGNTMFHSHLEVQDIEGVAPCSVRSQTSHARYLASDHLSPLLAQLLFVEVPRKILLLGSSEKGRSEVLTDSFSDTVDGYDAIPDIPYRQHFWRYNLEKPFAAELTGKPALVSVTTNVETGNRYVFSPFNFPSRGESHLDFFAGAGDIEGGEKDLLDPALSSVTVASASFPWVTPSLRFSWERGHNKNRDSTGQSNRRDPSVEESIQSGAVSLVDGGYFENSGALTMSEVMLGLEGSVQCANRDGEIYFGVDNAYPARSFPSGSPCTDQRVRCQFMNATQVERMSLETEWGPCEVPFHVVNIIIRDTPQERPTGGNQSFIWDPLKAMLNAREARGSLSVATLEERKCGFSSDASSCWANADATGSGDPYPQFWSGTFQSRIDSGAMNLPLGWHMPFDRMQTLEEYVAPDEEVCKAVGIPLSEANELYDFDPSSDYPAEIDLLLKRNCSHLRQIALFFDVEGLRSQMEWIP